MFRNRLSRGLPLVEKPIEEKIIPTFIESTNLFLATKEAGWKNAKHRAQWHMTLNVYAKSLHDLRVPDITTPDVLKVLQPIWLTKQETASRLRGRIEAVLDYAKAMGWRAGENPAVWQGNLKLILPQYSKTRNVKHHPALPFEEMKDFYPILASREALVARLLEFTILTAGRSGEARDARWNEINLEDMTWIIPAERMKMCKEHIVPLSTRAIQILEEIRRYGVGEYIFLHPTRKAPFSTNATRALAPNIPDHLCRLRIDTVASLLEAVRLGVGATILPCFIGENDPALVRLSPGEIISSRDIWLLVRSDLRKVPRIRIFLDFFAQHIKTQKHLIEST